MRIKKYCCGPFSTNTYVVLSSNSKKAIVIDPAPSSAELIEKLLETENLTLSYVLLTHSHWDHIADLPYLKKKFNMPVYVHPNDKNNLLKPGSDGLPVFARMDPVTPDYDLEEGQTVPFEEYFFEVIFTPGHTPGGVCFYEKKFGILFSGDTLFKQSIGNLSFPGCNEEDMWKSLKKLESLPPKTIVHPGHGDSTTIGNESWLPNASQIFS